MTNIRRYFDKGQICFLTHVTYKRTPILVDNINFVWGSFNHVRDFNNFELIAWVILPEHIHMIVDPRENDLSDMIKRFKLKFSGLYRSANNLKSGRLWQYRYWDRIIRDESDLNRHLDYIHYNPVKHGLSSTPYEYKHSSFRKFLEMGYCEENWASEPQENENMDYGE